MEEKEEEIKKQENAGAFGVKLKRNNKQIREDRADAIIRAARLKYKRKIEDLQEEIVTLESDRENMLDLSPTNAQNLTVASDFDSDTFALKDLSIASKLHDKKIEVELAKERFKYLFGIDLKEDM